MLLTPPYLIPLFKLLYPMKESDRVRDRPMEILCLGLSRSGTESLRRALMQLDHNEVHHAFYWVPEDPGSSPQFLRLIWRKHHTSPLLTPEERGLAAADFDKVLGNCMAVTDVPCTALACELIRAYPEAKVIVNKRDDVDAWYRSVMTTIETRASPTQDWFKCLFNSHLFWVHRLLEAGWYHYVGDFAKDGKRVHAEHYAEIDAFLAEEETHGRKREVLRWKAEDGWQPLTRFLGKKTPVDEKGAEIDFPTGNTPADFEATAKMVIENLLPKMKANQRRAAAVVVACVLGIVAWGIWTYFTAR